MLVRTPAACPELALKAYDAARKIATQRSPRTCAPTDRSSLKSWPLYRAAAQRLAAKLRPALSLPWATHPGVP